MMLNIKLHIFRLIAQQFTDCAFYIVIKAFQINQRNQLVNIRVIRQM